jgi:hypothetical protein
MNLRDMPLTTPEEIIAFRREALRQTDRSRALDVLFPRYSEELHCQQMAAQQNMNPYQQGLQELVYGGSVVERILSAR